ncbi:MAG: SgcJ/EcaC family oxidoreductase [Deltaproteobacteria bacterium]|nr:SgcJ/EcaC family oxidoreductase [Deltaproteobacteria bacterium]
MRALIGIVLVVLLSSCATQMGGSAAVAPGAKDQVAAATAAWVAAFNSRDPARITALYDPEAAFWGTTAKTISTNPAAIAEYFKDAPKSPNARVSIGEQHIRVYGDVAVNTGYYTFSNVRDGKPVANAARYTFVYKNRGGKWMIIDHHSSRVPGS